VSDIIDADAGHGAEDGWGWSRFDEGLGRPRQVAIGMNGDA
jgi:hypothetical protein